ncbi:hypothetical protein [Altererythrobacter sp.]|uniref:hypothetical protein n=1 Tax=Altererythrobacter sp. TaxID=1872480 RepID=UPI003CFF8C5E
MKKHILFAAFAISLGMSAPAIAHGSMEPSHGGVVQMSGEILVELVKTSKGLDVYITEEDEPLNPADFDAQLIVTPPSGQKSTTALKPAGGNRLTAAGLRPGGGTKVVVVLVNKSNSAKTFATFRYT